MIDFKAYKNSVPDVARILTILFDFKQSLYPPEVVHTTQSQLSSVHIEVDHRVHGDCDTVPGQDLGGDKVMRQ